MEHTDDAIISEKFEFMSIVKRFKEVIALYGYKSTETEVRFFEKAIKFHEELANNEDEDGIIYLSDRIIYIDNLFNGYVTKNNTAVQVSEEPIINNLTFIKTTEWLNLKNCVINSQNNDNRCFQCSVSLSLYHQEIDRNSSRISKIKPFVNNFD